MTSELTEELSLKLSETLMTEELSLKISAYIAKRNAAFREREPELWAKHEQMKADDEYFWAFMRDPENKRLADAFWRNYRRAAEFVPDGYVKAPL